MSRRFKADKHRLRLRPSEKSDTLGSLLAAIDNQLKTLRQEDLPTFAHHLSDSQVEAILTRGVAAMALTVKLWNMRFGEGMPEDRAAEALAQVHAVLCLEHLQRLTGESVYDPEPLFEPNTLPLRVPQIIGMPVSNQLCAAARAMLAKCTFLQRMRPDGVIEIDGPSVPFYARIMAKDLNNSAETVLESLRELIAAGFLIFRETRPEESGANGVRL